MGLNNEQLQSLKSGLDQKEGSGMEGGSIGQIPKDWVQRTTLIELDQEKKSEFRGRNVGRGLDTRD